MTREEKIKYKNNQNQALFSSFKNAIHIKPYITIKELARDLDLTYNQLYIKLDQWQNEVSFVLKNEFIVLETTSS